MHRLLQGDVGSGKTTVALTAMLAVVDGQRQCALMAPTEVLAEQHAAGLRADVACAAGAATSACSVEERDVRVGLLTGSVGARERRRVLDALAERSLDIVVGTHALLSEDVVFASLGLVVIDEQHRFGVEQRASLREKGRAASAEGRDPDLAR
jgi:ATP-dependent DNA helicase RecG